jgi:hypothetical protein
VVCLLVFFLLPIFVAFHITLGVLGVLFGFDFLNFFLFTRCIERGCLPCRCTFDVRGCPNNFWDLFSMFCPNIFLPILLFTPQNPKP